MQQAGHTQHGHYQAHWKAFGDLAQLAAFPEHGQAGRHHGYRQDHPCGPDRPAQAGVHDPTDDTGTLQVDREAGQQAADRLAGGGGLVRVDLGVDPLVIERDGAVSKAVVAAMAVGAAGRAGADLGIATSGIAGPGGGSTEKPVGTVWIAVADAGGVDARCFRLPGDRRLVRSRAMAMALQMVRFRATGVEASLLWERADAS